MADVDSRFSPRGAARLCGALYLYIILAGVFAEVFVRSRLVVSDDAGATARNVLAHEGLFRLGAGAELLHLACDVAVAALLWALLRPVGRTVALAAALFRVACDVVLAVASLFQFVALRLLDGGGPLERFSTDQLQTLALLALRLHGDGYAVSLIFFGFACLALGHLLWRAGFLPRSLGALMGVAGLCYLVESFAHLLAPELAGLLFPAIYLPAFVAELALTTWLLVKGVDEARWRAVSEGVAGARSPSSG